MSYQYQQFSVSVVGKDVTNGYFRPLRTFKHQGRIIVIGKPGTEYAIVVHNHTPERVEAVISVDGLDVLTGKKASTHAPGYVIDGCSFLRLNGFRTSDCSVATFTFGDVESSYAKARGETSSVGVIGVAIYREKPKPQVVYRARLGKDEDYYVKNHKKGYEPNNIFPCDPFYVPNADPGLTTTNLEMTYVDSDCYTASNDTVTAEGIGTQFGREQTFYADNVMFERDSPERPEEVFRIYYNSYEALVAMGVPVPSMSEAAVKARLGADPFPATPRKNYCEPPEGWKG